MPRFPNILLLTLVLASCVQDAARETLSADPASQAPAYQLPAPNVVMAADPPPPFTYWAPEGAVIRNHPNPGIWIAELNGRNVATYFGDACQASRYQQLVGQPMSALPRESAAWRLSCETCPVNSDLRPNRVNVLFEEATRVITKIACY